MFEHRVVIFFTTLLSQVISCVLKFQVISVVEINVLLVFFYFTLLRGKIYSVYLN